MKALTAERRANPMYKVGSPGLKKSQKAPAIPWGPLGLIVFAILWGVFMALATI